MPEQTCANCGTNVPDGATFCPECGTRARAEAAAPAAGSVGADPTAHDHGADDPTGVMATTETVPVDRPPDQAPPTAPSAWQTPPAEPGTGPAWQTPPAEPGTGPAWQTPTAEPGTGPAWQTPPAEPGTGPAWQVPDSAPPAAPGWQSDPNGPPSWQSPAAAAPPAPGPPIASPDRGWPASPPSGSAPSPSSTKALTGTPVAGAIAVVGGAVAVLSVWLTWIKIDLGTIGSTSASGWNSSDDAKIVLAIGIATVLLGAVLFAMRHAGLRLLVLAAGLGALAVGIRDLLDVATVADEIKRTGLPVSGHNAGIGLYLVLTAGILLVISAVFSFVGGSKPATGRHSLG